VASLTTGLLFRGYAFERSAGFRRSQLAAGRYELAPPARPSAVFPWLPASDLVGKL